MNFRKLGYDIPSKDEIKEHLREETEKMTEATKAQDPNNSGYITFRSGKGGALNIECGWADLSDETVESFGLMLAAIAKGKTRHYILDILDDYIKRNQGNAIFKKFVDDIKEKMDMVCKGYTNKPIVEPSEALRRGTSEQ